MTPNPSEFTESMAEQYAVLTMNAVRYRKALRVAEAEIRISLGSLTAVLRRYGSSAGQLMDTRDALERALAAIAAAEEPIEPAERTDAVQATGL